MLVRRYLSHTDGFRAMLTFLIKRIAVSIPDSDRRDRAVMMNIIQAIQSPRDERACQR